MKCNDLIPFAMLTKEIPGRPHISSLHRWRQHGIRGVRLRSYLCGGRRCSTLADVEEFFAQVTAAKDGTTSPRTTRQRQAAIRQAETELEKAGVK